MRISDGTNGWLTKAIIPVILSQMGEMAGTQCWCSFPTVDALVGQQKSFSPLYSHSWGRCPRYTLTAGGDGWDSAGALSPPVDALALVRKIDAMPNFVRNYVWSQTDMKKFLIISKQCYVIIMLF